MTASDPVLSSTLTPPCLRGRFFPRHGAEDEEINSTSGWGCCKTDFLVQEQTAPDTYFSSNHDTEAEL